MEKGNTAKPLEHADLVADCRRRYAQFRCGTAKTQMPRHGLEGAQLDQGRQAVHSKIVHQSNSPRAEIFEIYPAGPTGSPTEEHSTPGGVSWLIKRSSLRTARL
jgi:hypothetical protein